MSKYQPVYRPEFRQQMVELVQSGRTPIELAREFGCTDQSIRNWVAQAAIDSGKSLPGKEGLTSAEREELTRLRRENRRLQTERDILANRRRGVPRPIWIETGSEFYTGAALGQWPLAFWRQSTP